MQKFPQEIEDFGNMFCQLQSKRHSADYDPSSRFLRSEVLSDISAAEVAIRKFQNSPIRDRRAFAAWVALKNRF